MEHDDHAAAPPAHAGPVAVGALLKGTREARGLSVGQVADAIRVSPRHIRAIEAGRLETLPEGPYVRGFVEAFAGFVGLDPAATFAGLSADEEQDAQGRRIFRYPERKAFSWRDWTIPIGFASALALVGVAAALTDRGAALPEGRPALPAAAAGEEEPPHPALVGAAVDIPVPAGAPAPEEDPEDAVRVLLRSEGTTWVAAAADGGGERRYELAPGENLTLTAHRRLELTLGDAGLVRVRRGSRELGFVGERGEVRRGMVFIPDAGRPAADAAPAEAGD